MSPKHHYYDIEDVIVKVQEYPALYDKGHEEYKKLKTKYKYWRKIASELYTVDWPLWSEDEREEKVNEVKLKWRHVRDNYVKDVKLERKDHRSGSGRSKREPYIHSAIMSFLRPTVEMAISQDNIPFSSDEDSRHSMSTSGPTRQNSKDDEAEIDLTQENVEDADLESVVSDSAGKTASKKSTVVDSRPKIFFKKAKEEDLMSSLKTCMTVIKGKEQPLSEAQSLAQSLVPLIERVPSANMFSLRHALLDAIYAHIHTPSTSQPLVSQLSNQEFSSPTFDPPKYAVQSRPMDPEFAHSDNAMQSMHAQYLKRNSLTPAPKNLPVNADMKRSYQQFHLQTHDVQPYHVQVRKPSQCGPSRYNPLPPRTDIQSPEPKPNYQNRSSLHALQGIADHGQMYGSETHSFLNELRSNSPRPLNASNQSTNFNENRQVEYCTFQQGLQDNESTPENNTSADNSYFTNL